jgi:hypothetical protein
VDNNQARPGRVGGIKKVSRSNRETTLLLYAKATLKTMSPVMPFVSVWAVVIIPVVAAEFPAVPSGTHPV